MDLVRPIAVICSIDRQSVPFWAQKDTTTRKKMHKTQCLHIRRWKIQGITGDVTSHVSPERDLIRITGFHHCSQFQMMLYLSVGPDRLATIVTEHKYTRWIYSGFYGPN